ncbi:MAG: hypothetical protein CL878_06120 [Dehalococcoidia bacterium]|nr:hypothetical protein [Dehalococcoidia bacterium]
MVAVATADTSAVALPPQRRSGWLAGGLRFDWVMIVLCTWGVGGVFLDGWAHNHGRVDESFFTSWHAVLYSAFLAIAALCVFVLVGNLRRGLSWRRALPAGYWLTLVGVGVFGIGGLGDMVWHIVFGIEEDVEALLSPTHLTLALGGLLVLGGPLRTAWQRTAPVHGWLGWLPPLLSLTFMLSILTFMTQFAHPLVNPWATFEELRSEARSEIYVMNADGSGQTRLTMRPRVSSLAPTWSPDGSRLAFVSWRDGDFEVHVMDAEGDNLTRLSQSDVLEGLPAWSPDWTRLAFVSRRDGNDEIYVMQADGSIPRRLTENNVRDFSPAWSPDGNRLAFSSQRDGNRDIYVMQADGSRPSRLTSHNASDGAPAWSPDGSKIAFVSHRDGNDEIYVMQADGTSQTRLTHNDAFDGWPSWSADGTKLTFESARDGDREIYAMHADGSDVRRLSQNPGVADTFPAWSPDGNRIAFSARAASFSGLDEDQATQALGIAGILLQATLLIGAVLVLIQRWQPPLGSFTILFAVNAALLSSQHDHYWVIPVAVVAGLATDALFRVLEPLPARLGVLRLFAFVVPAVFYGLYFAGLFLTNEIRWTVHLWTGAIVLAGFAGLLLSYVFVSPRIPAERLDYVSG